MGDSEHRSAAIALADAGTAPRPVLYPPQCEDIER